MGDMREGKRFHIEPPLIKAGDCRVKLGGAAPLKDIRVLAEEEYQLLLSFFTGDIEKLNGTLTKKG